jgi:hypothetical protein
MAFPAAQVPSRAWRPWTGVPPLQSGRGGRRAAPRTCVPPHSNPTLQGKDIVLLCRAMASRCAVNAEHRMKPPSGFPPAFTTRERQAAERGTELEHTTQHTPPAPRRTRDVDGVVNYRALKSGFWGFTPRTSITSSLLPLFPVRAGPPGVLTTGLGKISSQRI